MLFVFCCAQKPYICQRQLFNHDFPVLCRCRECALLPCLAAASVNNLGDAEACMRQNMEQEACLTWITGKGTKRARIVLASCDK